MNSTGCRKQETGFSVKGLVGLAPRDRKAAIRLMGFLLMVAGLLILAACGGGSSSSSTTSTAPAVTLSPSSLTFTTAVNTTSAPQMVTITNSGTAELSFTQFSITPSNYVETNTCSTGIAAGASCTVSVTYAATSASTVTGTLSITDNASGSPQTVSLSGSGTTVSVSPGSLSFTTTTTSLPVTLSNAASSALSVTSIGITAGSSNFAETNNCGSSVAANSSCTINVTFTPPASGSVTGTLTIVDAVGTQAVSLSGTGAGANTASVTVSFGPNGYINSADSYYNGAFTTVTVCEPGSTTACTSIPNVLVDTDSVGLRVLSSAVTGLTLPQVTDATTNYPLYACVQFGDLSYTWGPMQMATVQVGGETANTTPGGTANAGIPIQVISSGTVPEEISYEGGGVANPCLVLPGTDTPSGGLDDDTVANLQANGILGIGLFPQDCGSNCESLSTATGEYLAYQSSTGDAYVEPEPLTAQAWNPVAAFPSDNNGVMLSLPTIASTGASTTANPVTGTLYFGINTQSNNQITTQTVYEVDCDGDFLQATYNGVVYQDVDSQSDCEPETSSFIDSGSNALYILDAGTLSSATGVTVNNCTDNGYYCPASTLNLAITLEGYNSTSVTGNGTISIESADTLFSGNEYAAFNDLGGASCVSSTEETCSPGTGTDYLDFGLPFFFGKPIFVGIEGSNSTYPNGYWAF
jgi:hypothetical protein